MKTQKTRKADEAGITPTVEEVTPETAHEWLSRRHTTRPLQKNRVAAYAGEMKAGRWRITHQGIAFDNKGRMIDGQHRSAACIAAGTPFRTMVFRKVPKSAVIATDTGWTRTAAHALTAKRGEHVDSSVTTLITNMLITDRITAPGNMSFGRPAASTASPGVYESFLLFYRGPIAFTEAVFQKNRKAVTVAPVRAAVAKAFLHSRKYRGGRKRLMEFCEILYTGETENISTDQAAIRLRNYLMENHDRSGSQRGIIYLKAAYCLDKFLLGEKVNIVKAASEDPFPLPKAASEFLPVDEELDRQAQMVVRATADGRP